MVGSSPYLRGDTISKPWRDPSNGICRSWDNPSVMHATSDNDLTPGDVRLRRILSKLTRVYGSPRYTPSLDPLGELVATILSQHTSDINSNRAYEALRAAFPTWDAVLDASPDELAEVIRCGGLAVLKSQRIQDIL